MKKILILMFCILCIGCTKEENNVTINVYENTDNKELVEKSQSDVSEKQNDIKEHQNTISENDNISEEKTVENNVIATAPQEKTSEKIISKIKETKENISDWYQESETKEVIDSNTLKAKEWLNENQDDLDEKSKQLLQQDAENLKAIKTTIKDWYNSIK